MAAQYCIIHGERIMDNTNLSYRAVFIWVIENLKSHGILEFCSPVHVM